MSSYGLSIFASGGAKQLNESSRCLRTMTSGVYNTNVGPLQFSGNQLHEKLIVVSNTNYVSKPSWYSWYDMGFRMPEYTHNLISNEMRYIPANTTYVWCEMYDYLVRYAICDALAPWTQSGYGMKILDTNGVVRFNSDDPFFVITSIGTLNFSGAIANGFNHFDIPISTAPYSDTNFAFVPPQSFWLRNGSVAKLILVSAFRLNATHIRVGASVYSMDLQSALATAPTSYQLQVTMGVIL